MGDDRTALTLSIVLTVVSLVAMGLIGRLGSKR